MGLRVAGAGVKARGTGRTALPTVSDGSVAKWCGVFCVPRDAHAYCRPVVGNATTAGTDTATDADVPVFGGNNRPIIFRTSGYTYLAHCADPAHPDAVLNIIPLEDQRP